MRVRQQDDPRVNIVTGEANKHRPSSASGAEARLDRAGKRERLLKTKKMLDETLEKGLEDTFPGSDPVAVTQPPHSPRDKHEL
jgi:hypothetical protein